MWGTTPLERMQRRSNARVFARRCTNMVPKHQLDGVGVEEYLAFQVGHAVFADVVPDQRYGNDQRDPAVPVPVDHLDQLLLFVGRQEPPEVPHHVQEHIGAFGGSGPEPQRLHEKALVAPVKLLEGKFLRAGHQRAHLVVPGPPVREEEEFVVGVERHETPPGSPLPDPVAQPSQGEHPLDEQLPQGRIPEPSFLLHGDQRETVHERLREHSGSDVRRDPVPAVDLDALHPGARRVFLADIAAKIQVLEVPQLPADPSLHFPGVIHPGPYGDQARTGGIPDKAHRLARRGKAAFRLGTDRHILDEPSQRFHEERIALVAAVVADPFPQQAGADEDPDRSVRQIGCGHRPPSRGIPDRTGKYEVPGISGIILI